MIIRPNGTVARLYEVFGKPCDVIIVGMANTFSPGAMMYIVEKDDGSLWPNGYKALSVPEAFLHFGK